MANPENLQSFLNQEKSDIKGIDQNDVKALNTLVFTKETNNSLSLKNEVKETFSRPENINAMVNGINTFLQGAEGTKLLQNPVQNKEILESYKNILSFLTQSNTQANSALNQNIQYLSWKIDNALSNKISSSPTSLESKEVIKKWSTEVINTLTRGLGSADTFMFSDEKVSSGAIKQFMEQYNNNSKEQLTYTNLLEQIYNLPTEQKDILATYFAQIIVSARANKEKRNQGRKHDEINKYRRNMFPKLFKENQTVPLLSDQKRAMVGDKTATDGLVSGINSEAGFGLGWYEYNETNPESTITTVDRLPGQNNLDLSLLTAGVDTKGAQIILDIGGTKIIGETAGDKNVNGSKANMINRNIPEKLPNGIDFQNGSFKIDAAKAGNKPQVKVTMNSLNQDEVFVTVGTNGLIRKNSSIDAVAGATNMGEKEMFVSGGREISEWAKKDFDQTLNSIGRLIRDRLPDGYNLEINVWAATSTSKMSEDLHEKLKTDIVSLKKSLATTITSKMGKEVGITYYQNLKAQVEAQLKHETFVDEGNKVLAQCRAYSTLNQMITTMSASELTKISLNITPLTGNSKRSSQFEMWGLEKISKPVK